MSHHDHLSSFHVKGQAVDLAVGGTWPSPTPPTSTRRQPEPDPPLFTEPVIGYRTWRIGDGQLVSPYKRSSWPPGVVVARCGRWHRPPAEGCACGLYAYHSPDRCRQMGLGPELLGAVVGWGAMDVFPSGWRAERACVVALLGSDLVLPYGPEFVAAEYGVPLVKSRMELQEEAAKHGAPLPRAEIPEYPAGEEGAYPPPGSMAAAARQLNEAMRQFSEAVAKQLAVTVTALSRVERAVAAGDTTRGKRPPLGPRARGGRTRGRSR